MLVLLTPFRYRILLEARPVGHIYGDYTDFLLFSHDIALLLLLSSWVVDLALHKKSVKTGPLFLLIPMGLFTVWIIGIAFVAIDPPLAFYHALRAVLLLGLYLFLVNQKSTIKLLIPLLSIQIIIQAIPALIQFIYQQDIGLQFLGEYALDPAWRGVSIVMEDGVRWLRGYGLSDHPNILGGSLAFGLVILIGWYMLHSSPKYNYLLAVISLGAAGLLITFSRSAGLALIAGIAFLFLAGIRRSKRYDWARVRYIIVALLLGILPLIIFYWGIIQTRMTLIGNIESSPVEIQSIGERAQLNRYSTKVFSQNPIIGVGFGSLPQALRQDFPEFKPYYQPAHMVLITAAAETGLIGSALYAIALIIPWSAIFFQSSIQESGGLLPILAALISITVIGFLDYYPWLLSTGRLWQYLIWGIWAQEYQKGRPMQVG